MLSGYIGIRAGRRPSFRLPIGRHVEEVPDKNSVIMGTADDLELVKLEPEHSARMFLGADRNRQRLLLRLILQVITAEQSTSVMERE